MNTSSNRTPLPVLFVNHSMAMGGIETLIVDFVRCLSADGVAPRIAVFEAGGSLERRLEELSIPLHRLGKRAGVDLRMVLCLRGLLKQHGIRVVHSHNFSTWLYSALAVLISPGADIVHVHTEHSNVEYAPRRYRLERLLGALTPYTVAVSRHVQDVMIRRIGIPARRVRLIYNGIDTSRFAPDPMRRGHARADLGIAENEILIGIVARLAPIKDHVTLLHGFRQLLDRARRPVRLALIGDGPERSAIDDVVRTLRIDERTLRLGERQDIPDLLNALDIYVLSSLNEGMNLTLLEAMGTGLPIVATAVGGNPEIVVPGATGLLVPSRDPTALAAALARLVESDAERLAFGSAGRARILEHFSQATMLRAYMELYRRQPLAGSEPCRI